MEAHLQYLAVPVLLYVAWRSLDKWTEYARFLTQRPDVREKGVMRFIGLFLTAFTFLITLTCLWNIVALENYDLENWRSFSEKKAQVEQPAEVRDMIQIRPTEEK